MTCITTVFDESRYIADMIQLLAQGPYSLIETKSQTKILILGGNGERKVYAWIYVESIGEILVASKKAHDIHHILSSGKYRLYEVHAEPKLTDLIHLELLAGERVWQGYLLPTGLPDQNDKKNLIIPTSEIITKSL